MSETSNPPINSKPGKWGRIIVPPLPEKLLKLEPRLESVPESAIIRFLMFKTGRRAVEGGFSIRGFLAGIAPYLAFGSPFGAIVVPYIVLYGFWAGRIRFNPGSPTFWIFICFLIVLGAIAIFFTHHNQSRKLLTILERHVADFRLAPLNGADYAIAHWGAYLLLDPVSRKFPATTLWACCKEMEVRLETCTGWSYYPSVFGIQLSDATERGELMRDRKGSPVMRNQAELEKDAFNYSARFDYLAALWREYMEVWWPDQPWEAEARRAMLPSRAQRLRSAT